MISSGSSHSEYPSEGWETQATHLSSGVVTLGAASGMSISPYTPNAIHSLRGHHPQTSPPSIPAVAFYSEPDVMKRDRFELLSAYLDGEVTPEERTLVQTWLSNDPTAKSLYNRLMLLRQGLREEACESPCEADVTLACVFHSLNHRFRMMAMAGAGVVVLGVLNVLSGNVGAGPGLFRTAQSPSPDVLQIALDQPAFPIPTVSASSDGSGSDALFSTGSDL